MRVETMLSSSGSGKPRVCVVGLDGVPHSLIKRFAAEGVMPATADLISRSRLYRMKVSLPEISAVSWTSFATGADPGTHGIFGFVDLKPFSYSIRFPSFKDCAADTIWDKVGSAGGCSVVINQPFTYPAKPMKGCLISGFVALDLKRGAYPPELVSHLQKIGYRIDIDTRRCREDHKLLWSELCETLDGRRKAVDLLWESGWDYFQVVVTGTDRLHHYLWDSLEDRDHPSREFAEGYYRKVDRFVGEIWKRFRALAGEEAVERFFLLSDHGFCGIESEVYLNRWLAQEGYLSLQEGPDPSLESLDEKSLAFCLDPGRIYINLKGRFPRGSVDPAEGQALKKEIKDKLLKLEHNGKPVVRDVFFRDEIYSGPLAKRGPDLVALSHRGFDLKGSLESPRVFGRSGLQGMHTWDDAFLVTGAEMKSPLFIWDLSDTILRSLGIRES